MKSLIIFFLVSLLLIVAVCFPGAKAANRSEAFSKFCESTWKFMFKKYGKDASTYMKALCNQFKSGAQDNTAYFTYHLKEYGIPYVEEDENKSELIGYIETFMAEIRQCGDSSVLSDRGERVDEKTQLPFYFTTCGYEYADQLFAGYC